MIVKCSFCIINTYDHHTGPYYLIGIEEVKGKDDII